MLILGSGSPRRKELLTQINLEFKVIVPQVKEYTMKEINLPADLVKANSLLKAKAISEVYHNDVVVTADTVVALDGEIFGKPKNEKDAYNILKGLSGKKHQVFTGITVGKNGKYITEVAITNVEMQVLTDEEIWEYIATKEPMDKAGAYGIQGYAARFIKGIVGCYFNVVGLPLNLFYTMYKKVDELNDSN